MTKPLRRKMDAEVTGREHGREPPGILRGARSKAPGCGIPLPPARETTQRIDGGTDCPFVTAFGICHRDGSSRYRNARLRRAPALRGCAPFSQCCGPRRRSTPPDPERFWGERGPLMRGVVHPSAGDHAHSVRRKASESSQPEC
jgi:hypothetical protein